MYICLEPLHLFFSFVGSMQTVGVKQKIQTFIPKVKWRWRSSSGSSLEGEGEGTSSRSSTSELPPHIGLSTFFAHKGVRMEDLLTPPDTPRWTVQSKTLFSNNEGESTFMSSQDISSLKMFLLEPIDGCHPTLILETISSIISKAMVVAMKGRRELAAFCNLLKPVLEEIMNSKEVVRAWIEQEDVQAQLFEVLCKVTELTVLLLATHNSPDRMIETTDTRYLVDTMEALCVVFKMNAYFTMRMERGLTRNLLIHPARVESAIQVPGYFVRVRDRGVTNEPLYYCSRDGINHRGRECGKGCCDSQSKNDAILVQLSCLMGRSLYGNGYKFIMEMLIHFKEYPLRLLEALFKILATLSFVPTGEKVFCKEDATGRKVLLGIQESFFNGLCQRMFHYLKKSIDAVEGDPMDVEYILDSLTSIVRDMHTISFLGSRTATGDLAGQLQLALWEAYIEKGIHWNACASIGDILECTFTDPRNALFSTTAFLRWLNNGDIIFELISFDYDLDYVAAVEDFVGKISKRGLLQQQHLMRLLVDDNSGMKPGEERHTSPHDLIVTSVMDHLHPNEISSEVLNQTVEWLERTKDSSSYSLEEQIPVQRFMSILEKLAGCDKDRTQKERILNLFWKHTGSAPAADLVNCMTKIADCYEPVHEFQSLQMESCLELKGEKDFLQACSSADADTNFINYLSGANCQSAAYAEKAKVWKEKEKVFYLTSLPQLEHLLTFDIPYSRLNISNECFQRLNMAQRLVASLQTPSQSTLASSMASAMSPEMQTLEALEKESKSFLELDTKIQNLNKKHFRLFEVLKREQHERLLEFFQDCQREKQSVMREVLYSKAKVAACTKRAQLDVEMSSDAILSRMLQRAEGVVKEVIEMEEKHKKLEEEMQRLELEKKKVVGAIKEIEQKHEQKEEQKQEEKPKPCAICYKEFGNSIQRGCFSPCGHASVCYDCALREKNGRGRCPFCQTDISSVCVVPSKIFF
ncbi:hypothetical protein M758_7G117400 [Ceratodon purpureus]|nr:hypothetical protein M758_7G117400 [Ceratodon purpureus]